MSDQLTIDTINKTPQAFRIYVTAVRTEDKTQIRIVQVYVAWRATFFFSDLKQIEETINKMFLDQWDDHYKGYFACDHQPNEPDVNVPGGYCPNLIGWEDLREGPEEIPF